MHSLLFHSVLVKWPMWQLLCSERVSVSGFMHTSTGCDEHLHAYRQNKTYYASQGCVVADTACLYCVAACWVCVVSSPSASELPLSCGSAPHVSPPETSEPGKRAREERDKKRGKGKGKEMGTKVKDYKRLKMKYQEKVRRVRQAMRDRSKDIQGQRGH